METHLQGKAVSTPPGCTGWARGQGHFLTERQDPPSLGRSCHPVWSRLGVRLICLSMYLPRHLATPIPVTCCKRVRVLPSRGTEGRVSAPCAHYWEQPACYGTPLSKTQADLSCLYSKGVIPIQGRISVCPWWLQHGNTAVSRPLLIMGSRCHFLPFSAAHWLCQVH